ncbi:MAG TPA: SIS domain-containing protein [Patescibacteria group bacterium]|nr:SIS domain-containing protein [Patescibacteria group bacterium]
MRRAPTDPLPGAPDPWAASEMPAFRSRPPYLMSEMIAAEPALAERLVRRLAADETLGQLADAVRAAVAGGHPVVTTGCGTSEHAAMAIAALLEEALDGPVVRSVQALESLRRPITDGLLIAVSHEGGTQATNAALEVARGAGARTALITVSGGSPGAALADLVVRTDEMDQSWCHTVGYLSPLVAGAMLGLRVGGRRSDAPAMRSALEANDDHRGPASLAAGLTGTDRIVVIGSGPDLVTARELALKISEGARLPATAYDVESILHGHLAAATRWTGMVIVATDEALRPERIAERAPRVLAAAAALGMPAAAILGERTAASIPADATPAGRIVLARPTRVSAVTGALLGPILPLQLLADRLARARGVNPDTLGREDPGQAAAHG